MKQNRRLQGSYATKENPFKHKNNDVVGEGKQLLRTTTMPLFLKMLSSFTLSPMFLGLPCTLGFDPLDIYHIACKLCATYCIYKYFPTNE
jgi:hypothetical protein